jgi:hypothetical protein
MNTLGSDAVKTRIKWTVDKAYRCGKPFATFSKKSKTKTMKKLFILLAPLALFACDIEKTEEGESPELDVDVQAESGEMPEYDVDWANVDVSTETEVVEVPRVIVTTEKERVEVPSIDVNIPDDDRAKEEQTIMVDVEVSDRMHEVEIEKVYATRDMLYVIAELEQEDEPLNGETIRVSDQIRLNAPDMNQKVYIVGERPQGDYNTRYKFIGNESEISSKLETAELIYEE